MTQSRKIREPGSLLALGGVEYRLEGLEGRGSSAVVYRASYEDSLSSGSRHHVFIKELFPLSRDGGIYREENGNIAWTADAEGLMEVSRSRFLLGNRVNLELLGKTPGAASGNLNSYEAYGTYYSVLSLHGGVNLKTLLVEEGKRYSLEEAAGVMEMLLSALEVFHREGLLHLDISPDNILLLPQQALLIDYNSVWDTKSADLKDFAFSEKLGYSAPEVKKQSFREIGYSTDLYSLCAVFFHLVMGRALRQEEMMGTGLRRSLSGNLAELWQVPQTAAAKAAQILAKGLHSLPRKRYPSILELRADLKELLDRIQGKGVTVAALWESGFTAFQNYKEGRPYLSQPVLEKAGMTSQDALMGSLGEGGCWLLTGPGGMGKTRALMELWKGGMGRFRPGMPVVLYIALKDYQQTPGESRFIRKTLLKGLRFSDQEPGWEDAGHALESLLEGQTGKGDTPIILLLDGLNEAGSQQERLLGEIEELGKKKQVGILVTDRSESVLTYGLAGFRPARLGPLSPEQIRQQLALAGLGEQRGLEDLLSNPMLLFLYIESMTGTGGAPVPDSPQALVNLYLADFCRKAQRTDSGDPVRQLCTRYLLEQLLPEIALGMQKAKKTVLTFEELCAISDKSYRALRDAAFGKAFPEYRGKSRKMLEKIASPSEWYDFAVNENLVERFGLLRQTAGGNFALLHDNFYQALTEQAEGNRKLLRDSRRRTWKGRLPALAAGLLLILALGWAGAAMLPGLSGGVSYTQEENETVMEAVTCLNSGLGRWSYQVEAQRYILSKAESSDILDNRDPGEKAFLEELIRKKQEEVAYYPVASMTESGDQALLELSGRKELFSLELWQTLTGRHEEAEADCSAALEYLCQRLCEEDSLYISLGEQEALVKAYQDYLDAETEYVSYLLAQLLTQLPEEQAEEVWKAMEHMEAFRDFAKGAGSVAPERLDRGVQTARSDLKKTRDTMLAQGFPLKAADMKEEE